jgi:hypothetical protein
MSWRVQGLPGFVATDSEALIVELVALQIEMLRQGVANEPAYGELYAAVFGDLDYRAWVYQPPATVAHGITRLVREMGLFVLQDDSVALGHMAKHVYWESELPPVRIARPGPIYTPTRAQQRENRNAFAALVHRAGAIAFAERLPSLPLGPSAEAQLLRVQLTELFDIVIAEAGHRNDGTQRVLRQIFAKAMQLINNRAVSPLEDAMLTNSPMPSLVCAHWAYREARQVQRIRNANPAAHPNFMATRLSVPIWP